MAVVLVYGWVAHVAFPHPVPFGTIVYGLVIGSINAMIAVGLILIYRANRIINFALAEMGIFGAILFEYLVRGAHIPWALAVPAGVAAGALLAGLLEYVLAQRFARSPRLVLTVATIGIAQVVVFGEFALGAAFGRFAATAGLPTPLSRFTFTISGQRFDGNALLLVVAVPILVGGLGVFLRRADFGIAMRASAENSERAGLLGVPVKRVSTVCWVLAGGFTALATILRVPVVGLISAASVVGPGLLLRALAAAVIASMEDLRTAVMAALFIGVVEQSLTYGYSGSTISDVVILGVILLALLLRKGRERADQAVSAWSLVEEVRPIPVELRRLPEVRWGKLGLGVVIAALVLTFPLWASDSRVNLMSAVAIFALVAVSLVVLTGWSGQISLGQFGIVGLGAGLAGRVSADLGLDWLIAILVAGVGGAAVALLLGTAALRIRGFFFAVTSLGFAVAMQTFFLNRRFFPHLLPTKRVTRPFLLARFDFESEPAFYFFTVAILALVILAVRALRRSRTGRVLIAMRDNERSAQSFGINRTRIQLLTFAMSGFIAGVAGALFAAHQHTVSAAGFTPGESLTVFAASVIGGLGSLPGAVLGALFVRGGTFLLPRTLTIFTTGLGLLIVLLVLPGGLGRLAFQLRDGFLRRVARRRNIVVPSLLADRRLTTEDAQQVEDELAAAIRRVTAPVQVGANR